MDFISISSLNLKLWSKFPWLEKCVRRIDVTDIGNQFDLMQLHKEQTESVEISKQEKLIETEKNVGKLSVNDWENSINTSSLREANSILQKEEALKPNVLNERE